MKTIKVLAFILALGAVAMSCSKSSTPTVSTQQAQSDISSSNSTLATELQNVSATPGAKALNSFGTVTGGTGLVPFGRISSAKNSELSAQMRVIGTNLHQMMMKATSGSARINGSEPFNYNAKKGVYTYNFDTKSFDGPTTSNVIEIKYPSDSTQTTDNADFQMTAYTEQQFTDGQSTWYSTTSMVAVVSVDGTQQASINFAATYDTNGNTTSANITLFLNPYTWTVAFDDRSTSSSSASFSLSKSGSVLLGAGGSVNYTGTKDPQNISAISAYIQVVDIRFTLNAANSVNADPADPNTFINISVSDKGASAGKVVFVADQTGGVTFDNVHYFEPYVQYNDGSTKDKLKDIFSSLATSLQSLVSNG